MIAMCYPTEKDFLFLLDITREIRKSVVATASRREGVYNRTGEPSADFCGEECWRSEGEVAFLKQKSRRERYEVRDDEGDGI